MLANMNLFSVYRRWSSASHVVTVLRFGMVDIFGLPRAAGYRTGSKTS